MKWSQKKESQKSNWNPNLQLHCTVWVNSEYFANLALRSVNFLNRFNIVVDMVDKPELVFLFRTKSMILLNNFSPASLRKTKSRTTSGLNIGFGFSFFLSSLLLNSDSSSSNRFSTYEIPFARKMNHKKRCFELLEEYFEVIVGHH